jgi:hypothetical protein
MRPNGPGGHNDRVRPRLLLAGCAALLLGSCRLDVTADLQIGDDGTGALSVTAVADADVVEQAPGLAADLDFADATAAGWTVDGPEPTEDGGLTIMLRHPVSSAEEATNLLASLGPPFTGVTLARTSVDETINNELSGQLVLSGGFAAFADAELAEAVGGTPFVSQLDAAGATPPESMSVTFRVDLPGDVERTTGTSRDGAIEWEAPLDGTSVDVATLSVQEPSTAPWWAAPLSVVALVLLVVWVVGATGFVAYVVAVRRHRVRRRR